MDFPGPHLCERAKRKPPSRAFENPEEIRSSAIYYGRVVRQAR